MADIEIVLAEQVGRTGEVSKIASENSGTLKYHISGSTDEAAIRTVLDTHIASTHPVTAYPLRKYTLTETGNGVWEAVAIYGRAPSEYRFSATTDKEKVSVARGQSGIYPREFENPPDLKRLIGVNDDRVEGVDIHARKFGFIERHTFARAYVSETYINTIARLVGTTNLDTFRGFANNEVLLTGIEGAYNDQDLQVALEFRFEVSRTETIWVPGVSRYDSTQENPALRWQTDVNPDDPTDFGGCNVTKSGWSYMWFRYVEERDVNAASLVRLPKEVYVEKVYEIKDWTPLGIGS